MAPPTDFTAAELVVWDQLFHEAQAAGTLTAATVGDFAALCRLEVEAAECLAQRREEGWTTRGMFLSKEYRALVKTAEAKRRGFRLAPMGKPMLEPEQPENEFGEFFGPPALSLVK